MFHGLAAKFSIGVFVIVALLFSIYGTYDYQDMSSRLYKDQEGRVTLVVNSLSGTVSTALWNYESETITSALKSNLGVPGISIVGVINAEGQLLDAFTLGQDGKPEQITDIDLEDPALKKYALRYRDGSKIREVGNLFLLLIQTILKLNCRNLF